MSAQKKPLKKLKNQAQHSGKKIYFFDESRFGTHSKLGRAWFKKGSRTRISYNLEVKSFYVYIDSDTTGDSFTIIAEAVNQNILQVFLDEFAKNAD